MSPHFAIGAAWWRAPLPERKGAHVASRVWWSLASPWRLVALWRHQYEEGGDIEVGKRSFVDGIMDGCRDKIRACKDRGEFDALLISYRSAIYSHGAFTMPGNRAVAPYYRAGRTAMIRYFEWCDGLRT